MPLHILIKKKYFASHNFEIEIDAWGHERKLHYLYGGDGLFAIYVIENGTGTMNYIHKNYQGTYQAISDNNGNLVEKLSFGPCLPSGAIAEGGTAGFMIPMLPVFLLLALLYKILGTRRATIEAPLRGFFFICFSITQGYGLYAKQQKQ